MVKSVVSRLNSHPMSGVTRINPAIDTNLIKKNLLCYNKEKVTMTKQQTAPQLQVKTNLKAGKHCWDALSALVNDPKSHSKRDKFVDCCRNDKKCLA